MFENILCQIPDYDPDAILPLIELAIEIAREGREGRRIGTLFTFGDEAAVLAVSRPLILDPLAGHPEQVRHMADPNLRGTIKELAQLDGAFVVSSSGVFVAACRYLNSTGASGVEVPLGLGSRHLAAAGISTLTKAIGLVVSESSVVRMFCHGAMVAEIIPELWLLSRGSTQIRGPVSQERIRDLAVITPRMAFQQK
ncbi:MAG TPA: diadenylate cyclase [Bryobacteraceae bacterium]|nr:diadenylate cyclase [Bryobacteraceae bacterium]